MSELKVYSQCYDGTDGLFYLKSEADKVIADLDSRNAQLRKDKANLLRNNENLKLEIKTQKLGRLNDKIQHRIAERHANYKRCLAMARRCHNESLWWYSKGYGFEKYDKFWEKWEKRWLELAKKFKEAK